MTRVAILQKPINESQVKQDKDNLQLGKHVIQVEWLGTIYI
jgi:hypothetical protein